MDFIKKYLEKIYREAAYKSRDNITICLSDVKTGGSLLDVGCWDGSTSKIWAHAISSEKLYGIEIVKKAAIKARKKGITVFEVDIDKNRWPFASNSFDCVVSNLVIEHLSEVDHFISESYRVLKKGGITIVSTNNLSSWHNIASLLFGWTPFDLTNTSPKRWSIGNPLAIHGKEKMIFGASYSHKCVYTAKWLQEWYEIYKFKRLKNLGAGYYPLPPFFGSLDKRHCALITLSFVKR